MIELLEGVQEDLPVAANVAAVVVALRQLFERVVDRGDHRAEEFGECLRRLLGEVHEDEPLPHLAVHRHEAVVGLVDPEELALLKDEGASGRRDRTVQPWYLQANCRQVPLISSAGWSVHTSLLPRWRQTLWKARILSSMPRTTISEVLRDRELLGEEAALSPELLDPPDVQPGPLEDGLALELVELG